jgi:hypothetical protein
VKYEEEDTERGVAVTLTTETSEVLGSSIGRDSDSPDADLSWFYRVSQSRYWVRVSIRQRPLPTKSFPVLLSSVCLSFDAIELG